MAALLAEKHDLTTPGARATLLEKTRNLQTQRAHIIRERARTQGLALEGDLPGGGRFALVGFEDGQPVYHRTENLNAAITTAANLVRETTPFSVTGSSVVIGLWEPGSLPLATHQEFGSPSRITLVDTGSAAFHSTHVAGTLIAAGLNPSVKGMAPAATIRAFTSTNDSIEMTAEGAATSAEPGKITLSNHSYGSARGWETDSNGNWTWAGTFSDDNNAANDVDRAFGRYSITSNTIDGVLYNLPYFLPFISAGNHRNDGPPANGATWYVGSAGNPARIYDSTIHPAGDGSYKNGYDTVEGNKVAKNTFVVGAVNDAVSGGTRALGAATMSAFSSWGPTDDGRIKPDVVANGASLLSTSNTSASATGSASGTSMAAPNAAGSAALLIDYYGSRHSSATMRASTLKALIIHTADDLGNAGPDYVNGWGLMNTFAAAQLIKNHADANGTASILENTFTEGGSPQTYSFYYDGLAPFRATLCWTDPAGAITNNHDDRTPNLVNDLDLSVVAPDSTTLLPYIMPHVGLWTDDSFATPATYGVNHVDNVEQVYRPSAAAGIYTATITRTGTLTHGSQPWSLVVSGQTAGPLTPLQLWRYQNWNTVTPTATTSDDADPDNDGLPNLVEYAFALSPTTPTPLTQLPEFVRTGDTVAVNFATPAGVSGITYSTQISTDLITWQSLSDTGSGSSHQFTTSMNGLPRLFLRIVVTAP
jgi:hypothetical protein